MAYIILGANGYVGKHLVRVLDNTIRLPWQRLLKEDTIKLAQELASFAPEKIQGVINAAGVTGRPNVDACETETMDFEGDVFRGNVLLPELAARLAKALDVPFLHVSSGCIYNGPENIEFSEEHESNFDGSWYSITKAMGEAAIRAVYPYKSYICRLRIPFCQDINNPRSYIYKVKNYPKLLNVANSITYLPDFAWACKMLLDNQSPYGTYNICNPGPIKAADVIDMLKRADLYKGDPQYFRSIKEFESTVVAKRSNCVLSTKKIQSVPRVDMIPAKLALWSVILNHTQTR